MKKKILTVYGIALLVLIVNIIVVQSIDFKLNEKSFNIIVVDKNGKGDYNTIEDAIKNCSNGDTILVYEGEYKESIIINKSVKIIGMTKDKCIVRNKINNSYIFQIDSCDSEISNMTLINNNHSGIVKGNKLKNFLINNCSLSDCNVAISLLECSNIGIIDCEFYNNRMGLYFQEGDIIKSGFFNIINNSFSSKNSSIFLRGFDNSIDTLKIVNNRIRCSTGDYTGVLLINVAKSYEIHKNFFSNCGYYYDGPALKIETITTDSVSITECIFYNNNVGILSQDQFNIENNIFQDNKIGIIASNNNNIKSNIIMNNTLGLSIVGDNNYVYNNKFIDNIKQIEINGLNNKIYRIYARERGNYWSDYVGFDKKSGENQDIHGSDGIGDTPYYIDPNNIDRYPLFLDVISPNAELGDDIRINESSEYLLSLDLCFDDQMITKATWIILKNDEMFMIIKELEKTIKFEYPGLYKIILTVYDYANNSDSDEINITVIDIYNPNAQSQGDISGIEGDTILFNGSLSYDTGGIAKYEWLFDYYGTSHVLEGINVSFFFDRPGRIPVTLRVTDNVGHVGESVFNVTIRDLTSPVANAGDDIEIENGEEALFDGSLSTDNGILRYYNWSFSYNNTLIYLTGMTTSHIFEIPGYYDVTLRIEDEFGNNAEDTLIVTVIDTIPPVPEISGRTKLFENEMLELNGYDSTDNGKIVRYVWTFVDDEPVEIEGPTLSYQFKVMSDHEVFLTLYDEWNNSATTSVLVEIADQTAPKANAGPDQKVAVGSIIILNGSLSTDNGIISRYTWAFTYLGEKKTLEGEVVSFKFDEAGEYQIILSVFDLADNYGDDKVVITVVGTGKLNGIVLDADGKPVPGATFEALASDGKTYTATTLSDGSFSLEIPHGPFSWKIMKDGYKPISGTGSIDALEDKDLDLSGSALEKEEGKSFPTMLVVIPAIIILLLIVGIVLFLVLRKKKEEPQEEIEKIEEEKAEPEPSPEGSIPPEDSEFTQPPPVMEEDEEEVDPFKEEGSRDLGDLLGEGKDLG